MSTLDKFDTTPAADFVPECCRYCRKPLMLTKELHGRVPTKRNKGGYYFDRVWCCITIGCRCYMNTYCLEKDKRWFPGCGPHTRIERMKRHHRLPKQPQPKQQDIHLRQDAMDDGEPPA